MKDSARHITFRENRRFVSHFHLLDLLDQFQIRRTMRLFQTAFTTKRDGMGFGLSIVSTIVEIHRGRVSYEPNVPRGAVFRVFLPTVGT